jgi:hypothetical protein
MTHAYDQRPKETFPQILKEGIAEMTSLIIQERQYQKNPKHLKLFQSDLEDFERTTKLINVEETRNNSLSGTLGFNPIRAEAFYNAAGFLFYKWYKAHPDFFKTLRQAENDFFTKHNKLPTRDEWVELGEKIQPGFKSWLDSNPILNIKD